MKKISLKNLNLKEVEQLSREQLKNVLGGMTGSGSTGDNCPARCEQATMNGMEYGTCKSKTIFSGGQSLTYCECSLPRGAC